MQENVVVEQSVEDQLNELRKKCRKNDIIWKSASLTSLLLTFAFFFLVIFKVLPQMKTSVFLIISLILLILIFISVYLIPLFLKTNKLYKDYSVKYKNTYLKPLLEDAFKRGDYETSENISIKDITQMSMLKKAKSAVANDCIRGNYEGIDFLRYDLALSYDKRSEGSSCVLIVCNVNTKIDNEVQIIDNQFKIGSSTYEMPEGYCGLRAGNDSFDKRFTVYSKSQGEGQLLLNEDFIKALEKLKLGGHFATFYESDCVTAIIRRKRDVMEAPIYKSVSRTHAEKEAKEEVEIIKDFIKAIHKYVEK